MHGSLHIISGTMFGGKTTELIRRAKKVPGLIFNHALDSRYGVSGIFTHTGECLQCISIHSLWDIVSNPNYQTAKHIYIDEFQFFDESTNIILKMVEIDNKHVTCSGLLIDTKRASFGHMLSLIPLADTYVEKKGVCCEKSCLDTGVFVSNSNKIESSVQVGSDQYKLFCRYHYLKLND